MRRRRGKKFKRIRFKLNPRFLGGGIFTLSFLLFFSFLGKVIYKSDIFKVKEIKSNVVLDEDLKKRCEGQSMFDLNSQELRSSIITRYPEYKEATVLKEFPHRLKIEIKKREPVVQIKGKKFYPVDREGVILDENLEPFLNLIPVEVGNEINSLRKGKQIRDERLGYVFNFLEEIRKRNFINKFSVELVNASFPRDFYFVISGAKVIIGEEDWGHKLYILENLLARTLKNDLSSVKYIDLRYKRAYVGFKQ